jgi:hypothetical protein
MMVKQVGICFESGKLFSLNNLFIIEKALDAFTDIAIYFEEFLTFLRSAAAELANERLRAKSMR